MLTLIVDINILWNEFQTVKFLFKPKIMIDIYTILLKVNFNFNKMSKLEKNSISMP